MPNKFKMPNNWRDQYTAYREVRLSVRGRSGAFSSTITKTNSKAKEFIAALQEYTVLIQLGLGEHPQCG